MNIKDRRRALKAMNGNGGSGRVDSGKVLEDIIRRGFPNSEPEHLSDYYLYVARLEFNRVSKIYPQEESDKALQLSFPQIIHSLEQALSFNPQNANARAFLEKMRGLVVISFTDAAAPEPSPESVEPIQDCQVPAMVHEGSRSQHASGLALTGV